MDAHSSLSKFWVGLVIGAVLAGVGGVAVAAIPRVLNSPAAAAPQATTPHSVLRKKDMGLLGPGKGRSYQIFCHSNEVATGGGVDAELNLAQTTAAKVIGSVPNFYQSPGPASGWTGKVANDWNQSIRVEMYVICEPAS